MPKSKKAEEDKNFSVTLGGLHVLRTDEGEETLLNMPPMVYPNLNRVDIVLLQHAYAQTALAFVELGYGALQLKGDPEVAAFAAAMRERIRMGVYGAPKK